MQYQGGYVNSRRDSSPHWDSIPHSTDTRLRSGEFRAICSGGGSAHHGGPFLAPPRQHCPPGNTIGNPNTCQQAYNVLRSHHLFHFPPRRPLQKGSWPNVPHLCSIQYQGGYVNARHDQSPHFSYNARTSDSRLHNGEFRDICSPHGGPVLTSASLMELLPPLNASSSLLLTDVGEEGGGTTGSLLPPATLPSSPIGNQQTASEEQFFSLTQLHDETYLNANSLLTEEDAVAALLPPSLGEPASSQEASAKFNTSALLQLDVKKGLIPHHIHALLICQRREVTVYRKNHPLGRPIWHNRVTGGGGGWGGRCRCPDGKIYYVGDQSDSCVRPKCNGGKWHGHCNRHHNPAWAGKGVSCADVVRRKQIHAKCAAEGRAERRYKAREKKSKVKHPKVAAWWKLLPGIKRRNPATGFKLVPHGATWNALGACCKTQGKRLCGLKTLCPHNKPRFAADPGDKLGRVDIWAPVAGDANQWVELKGRGRSWAAHVGGGSVCRSCWERIGGPLMLGEDRGRSCWGRSWAAHVGGGSGGGDLSRGGPPRRGFS